MRPSKSRRRSWKGAAGSAVLARPAHARVLLEAIGRHVRGRGRLLVRRLRVGGAMPPCTWSRGRGRPLLGLKIGYDETLVARHSPGSQLICATAARRRSGAGCARTNSWAPRRTGNGRSRPANVQLETIALYAIVACRPVDAGGSRRRLGRRALRLAGSATRRIHRTAAEPTRQGLRSCAA